MISYNFDQRESLNPSSSLSSFSHHSSISSLFLASELISFVGSLDASSSVS